MIVRDPETKKRLVEAAGGQRFIGEAPIILVACAETDNHVMTCGQLCYPIDVSIALDHIILAATELGLGTCWIGLFDEKKVKEILRIPQEIRVVALTPIGYPSNPSAVEKNRFPLDTIVKYEYW